MRGSLRFIGNATVLIRYNGFTLLTDPNFLHRGQRAHLGCGLFSRRLTDPAVPISALPPLDAVVLSHLHGDHWDRVTHRELDRATPVITTGTAAGRLRRRGFRHSVGLAEWQHHELRGPQGGVRITALPARHAAGPAEALLPQVIGMMLEFTDRRERVELRVHISGDTLLDHRLTAIPRRFPDIHLAIAHLGGTRLFGTLLVTMDGEQGASWVALINPHTVVPVHYAEYTASTSPLDDFRHHVEQAGLADRVVYLRRGETRELAPHHLVRR
ncbi:MBL fold metallo-hydrolase [Nonomuraea sp. B12E4]|uniref:MBL fold metallo-hydrolase n=1 Tax=Nonomuraea sp. B12E4 TaxID=3153564 RepID=UPI00325E747D